MPAHQPAGIPVDTLINALRKTKAQDVSLHQIMGLASIMAESLETTLKPVDDTVSKELIAIADEIQTMKQELHTLETGDIAIKHIPEAGRELDEIVAETENATNRIMEAAETIMAADPSSGDDYLELVNTQVMEIFEACSFQDITGQRVGKVVTTLNHIDQRVSSLLHKLRLSMEGRQAETIPAIVTSERQMSEEERDQNLLNGPQLSDGTGISQDDIDALFG